MKNNRVFKGKADQSAKTVDEAKRILIQKLRECTDSLGNYTELVRENRNPQGGQTRTYLKMLEFQQVALATRKQISVALCAVKKIPTLHEL